MALLTIRSTNPNFSYIIAKNPSSPIPLVKGCRQGLLYGFFSPKGEYIIWFRDSDTEVSYKANQDADFEYLDTSRFNSPFFVVSAISDMLGSALKKRQEHDQLGFDNELTVNLFAIANEKYIEIFQNSFKDFSIETVQLAPKNVRLTIRTKKSIYELLNFACLFGLFNAIAVHRAEEHGKENSVSMPFVVDSTIDPKTNEAKSDFLSKYLGCLNVIDAPYLVRYVFKVNLMRKRELFNRYKSLLEQSQQYKIVSTFGSTTVAREDFVLKHIGNEKKPILDIGCGEGHYVRLLADTIDRPYVCVDTDPECLETVKRVAHRKMLDNVSTYNHIDAAIDGQVFTHEPINVLLIEILEHMSEQDAAKMLQKVLSQPNVSKVLITTPNHLFNENFQFGNGELRHDDHVNEFTQETFAAFLKANVPQEYRVQTSGIGDVVNNISMGLSAVISRC